MYVEVMINIEEDVWISYKLIRVEGERESGDSRIDSC
jgi:hypothetical protein